MDRKWSKVGGVGGLVLAFVCTYLITSIAFSKIDPTVGFFVGLVIGSSFVFVGVMVGSHWDDNDTVRRIR